MFPGSLSKTPRIGICIDRRSGIKKTVVARVRTTVSIFLAANKGFFSAVFAGWRGTNISVTPSKAEINRQSLTQIKFNMLI